MTRQSVVRAAGGLLWRDDPAGVRAALVHRPRYDDWSLPKGKLEPGEHPLLAAYREVAEESGVRAVLGPRLPTLRYPVAGPDGPQDKLVDFWSMTAGPTDEFVPNDEVDAVRWLPLDELTRVLADGDYAPVVAAFAALPRITGTVLLVRHASAGDPDTWPGLDGERPLDERGQAQSRLLAELLPLFAPDRAFTATPRRCVQTIAGVSARLGLTPVTDAVFDQTAHDDHPERAAHRVRALARAGGCALVASQGGIIPDIVALLADADGVPVPSLHTPKGAGWILSFAGGRLVAVDRFTTKGF